MKRFIDPRTRLKLSAIMRALSNPLQALLVLYWCIVVFSIGVVIGRLIQGAIHYLGG